MKKPTVSVIVPIYNVEGILYEVLSSLYIQTYPILEILLVDNHSPDGSVAVANTFISKHKNIPIKLIKRQRTFGLSDSYNLGASQAKGEYIVTLHSDSMLPSKHELSRLMKPFVQRNVTYIAAMPLVVHRKREWDMYNFWQKCLFAHVVGKEGHALNGKFDAYNRSAFLSIGGYDNKNFNHVTGSEDADMHFRLKSIGSIASTHARVVHLHGKDESYTMSDWILRRKFLAKAYAKQLSLHWKVMGGTILIFIVKPLLSLCLLFALFNPVFIIPVIVFPFVYMKRMFLELDSYKDINIIILPILVVYLLFAETIWMIEGLRSGDTRV